MLDRTNLTRHVVAESHVTVCPVLCMWFAVVVCVNSLRVCFICELVVICCSVSVAECNIYHIWGLKLCWQRKRNYTAQKWECHVDEVYLRNRVLVRCRCWLKTGKGSSVNRYRYVSARPNLHLAGCVLEIGKRSNSNWTVSAFCDTQTRNTKTVVVDTVDFFFCIYREFVRMSWK